VPRHGINWPCARVKSGERGVNLCSRTQKKDRRGAPRGKGVFWVHHERASEGKSEGRHASSSRGEAARNHLEEGRRSGRRRKNELRKQVQAEGRKVRGEVGERAMQLRRRTMTRLGAVTHGPISAGLAEGRLSWGRETRKGTVGEKRTLNGKPRKGKF